MVSRLFPWRCCPRDFLRCPTIMAYSVPEGKLSSAGFCSFTYKDALFWDCKTLAISSELSKACMKAGIPLKAKWNKKKNLRHLFATGSMFVSTAVIPKRPRIHASGNRTEIQSVPVFIYFCFCLFAQTLESDWSLFPITAAQTLVRMKRALCIRCHT